MPQPQHRSSRGGASIRGKPDWLKVRLPSGEEYTRLKALVRDFHLHTVCEEALCPNISECWGGGTATFMLLGDICTRGCRFCAVRSGNPRGVIDDSEPQNIARAVEAMDLKYVVLTSVDRDDLPFGGADHFARTIQMIRDLSKDVVVEALIPDFRGSLEALQMVVDSHPHILGHNIETTRSLTPRVRDYRASYDLSLYILKSIKKLDPKIYTKSSLMLGFGEREEEVLEAMHDLRSVDVDILTIGQYLRPTSWHLPVVEYISPDKFQYYASYGEKLGFLFVASSPLVRSSYRAGELFLERVIRRGLKD